MEALKALADRYGKETFGVAVLVVLWLVIVRPTLDAARLNTEAFVQVSQALKGTADGIARAAEALSTQTARSSRP
jgi:type II secretory pathway component PulM